MSNVPTSSVVNSYDEEHTKTITSKTGDAQWLTNSAALRKTSLVSKNSTVSRFENLFSTLYQLPTTEVVCWTGEAGKGSTVREAGFSRGNTWRFFAKQPFFAVVPIANMLFLLGCSLHAVRTMPFSSRSYEVCSTTETHKLISSCIAEPRRNARTRVAAECRRQKYFLIPSRTAWKTVHVTAT